MHQMPIYKEMFYFTHSGSYQEKIKHSKHPYTIYLICLISLFTLAFGLCIYLFLIHLREHCISHGLTLKYFSDYFLRMRIFFHSLLFDSMRELSPTENDLSDYISIFLNYTWPGQYQMHRKEVNPLHIMDVLGHKGLLQQNLVEKSCQFYITSYQ